MEAKIAVWDIEASDLNADFGIMLCACIKWIGQKKIETFRIDNYPGYDKNRVNDKKLVWDLRQRLMDADLLVHHYGDKYDLPFLNTRLLFHKFPVIPTNIRTVDTWRIARYKMKLRNNRLATLTEFFDSEKKTPIIGPVWLKALTGHRASMNYIVKHCQQDVKMLEDVYLAVRPLMTNHPNLNIGHVHTQNGILCPGCGSEDVQKRGMRYTRTGQAQRYWCKSCGMWSSGGIKKYHDRGVEVLT